MKKLLVLTLSMMAALPVMADDASTKAPATAADTDVVLLGEYGNAEKEAYAKTEAPANVTTLSGALAGTAQLVARNAPVVVEKVRMGVIKGSKRARELAKVAAGRAVHFGGIAKEQLAEVQEQVKAFASEHPKLTPVIAGIGASVVGVFVVKAIINWFDRRKKRLTKMTPQERADSNRRLITNVIAVVYIGLPTAIIAAEKCRELA